MSFQRMAGFSGLASVALFIASFVSYGTPPSIDATGAEIAAYIADTGTFQLGAVFGALAALTMLVFFIGFATPISAGDRELGEAFGTVIVAAATVAVTCMGVGVAMFAALGARLESLDEPALWVLWDGGNLTYAFAVVTFPLVAASTAMAIGRRGILKPSFAVVSWVAAIVALGGFVGFLTLGTAAVIGAMLGYLSILVWIVMASIPMVRTDALTGASPG